MSSFTLAFARGDSPLHRLNPLTVGMYAVCVTVLGMVGRPPLMIGLFCLTAVLAVVGRVGRPFIGMLLRIIIPIAIPLFIIQSLFNPIGRTVIYELGPLAVKQEGLDFAVSVITRLLALVAAYFLLVLVVQPRDLVIALEQRGMSPKLGYLLLSTLQLVPQIQRTAETILDAQRSRGLRTKGSLWVRFSAYVPLMGPVVQGSLSSLEIRAMALETRGFNLPNRKVHLRVPEDTPRDRLLRWGMAAATLVLIVVSVIDRIR
jgi:energy-coupling factor transport system permease protein